ncbi:MAG: Lrp/AsnC family transcriptional regulator [Nanoarchaeota archaeon]|nr:Lrp/AsnC family transcriptional regulator [Nanoarchaeota archaeon]
MNLTQNEQKVLKYLIDDGRATDMEIAKKLNISSQAVGKIRKKLENDHIIVGYEAKLNFEKLGITTFAIARTVPAPALWEEFGEQKFYEIIGQSPYIIGAFQTSSNELMIIGAFRDPKELDIFVHQVMIRYGKFFSTIDVRTFSNYGFKKMSSKKLLKYFIESMGKPKQLYPFRDQKEGIPF